MVEKRELVARVLHVVQRAAGTDAVPPAAEPPEPAREPTDNVRQPASPLRGFACVGIGRDPPGFSLAFARVRLMTRTASG